MAMDGGLWTAAQFCAGLACMRCLFAWPLLTMLIGCNPKDYQVSFAASSIVGIFHARQLRTARRTAHARTHRRPSAHDHTRRPCGTAPLPNLALCSRRGVARHATQCNVNRVLCDGWLLQWSSSTRPPHSAPRNQPWISRRRWRVFPPNGRRGQRRRCSFVRGTWSRISASWSWRGRSTGSVTPCSSV